MSTATAPPPPYQPSSNAGEPKKSRVGCIVLGIGGGCLLIVLMCGGLAGLGVFGLFTAIKSSEPYTESLARAKANAEVAAALGEPIETGTMVQGNINLNNNDGEADLNYAISGPEGSGRVDVTATKTNGVWTYQEMTVTVDGGGPVIDLLE